MSFKFCKLGNVSSVFMSVFIEKFDGRDFLGLSELFVEFSCCFFFLVIIFLLLIILR